MLFVAIMHHYILWHYSRAFAQILHVWSNLFWFTYHFFSLPQLLGSFFLPWKRMTEERKKNFSFENIAGFIIINLMSRLLGIVLRSFILIVGLLVLLGLTIGLLLTYAFWLLAPVILIFSIIFGLWLIIL